MGLATCVVLIALLSACAPLAHAFKHYAHGQTCLIFSGIDSNGDGRIDSAERGKAIGAAAAPSSSARAGAASPPLSAQELCQNWGRVCSHMTVDDVVAWVSHSVLLPPPVAEQFRLHSIGGCDLDDFNDGVLANEIGIAAPLHRKKIINAIRMKLFGQHDGVCTLCL